MCGRYALEAAASRLTAVFESVPAPEITPRWNIAPSSQVPVVHVDDAGRRVVEAMHWGLVPSWADDMAIGQRLANARGETVDAKPAFRAAFRRHRCLLPMSAFYEWQALRRDDGRVVKQPWCFAPSKAHQPDDLFAVAGLVEHRPEPAAPGGVLWSCCLITTAANDLMAPIHDRMPVIVPRERWAPWLDRGNTEVAWLRSFLLPYPSSWMRAWPVSRAVNNPAHEGAGLLAPVAAPEGLHGSSRSQAGTRASVPGPNSA